MKGPAEPPRRCWVSFCVTCGCLVVADATKEPAVCPKCPQSRGRIRYARFALVND